MVYIVAVYFLNYCKHFTICNHFKHFRRVVLSQVKFEMLVFNISYRIIVSIFYAHVIIEMLAWHDSTFSTITNNVN